MMDKRQVHKYVPCWYHGELLVHVHTKQFKFHPVLLSSTNTKKVLSEMSVLGVWRMEVLVLR